MGAIHAAMAGAVAGDTWRCRLLEKINQSFDSSELRHEARTVFNLILEIESGNTGIAIICFILGIPSMFCGAILGETIGGDFGAIIGSFAGIGVLFGLGYFIDNCLCRYPARKQLRRFIETHPQGKSIEQKVREILSSN